MPLAGGTLEKDFEISAQPANGGLDWALALPRQKDGTIQQLRVGFKGKRYDVVRQTVLSYDDEFEDFWSFLEPRLEEAWRLLNETGTLYLHLDYREAHYAKVLLDALFGRECFLNEIIWAYDYGGKSKNKWPSKHDTILVYVKDPKTYYFDSEFTAQDFAFATALVGLRYNF